MKFFLTWGGWFLVSAVLSFLLVAIIARSREAERRVVQFRARRLAARARRRPQRRAPVVRHTTAGRLTRDAAGRLSARRRLR